MTITVKHVIDRGNETIHFGTHVSWHEQQTSDDNPTELVLHNRDLVVARFCHEGTAYVVNGDGKTVGVYRLPKKPGPVVEQSRTSILDRARNSVAEAIAER